MKRYSQAIERLRDALLKSGRRASPVESSAYEALARAGLLTPAEKQALSRVEPVAEALFLVIAADEKLAESELLAIRGAIRGLTGGLLQDGAIKVMIETFALRLRDEGRAARLAWASGRLKESPEEVENAYALAAAVALADDLVQSAEDEVLKELAMGLGLEAARAEELLLGLDAD